MPERDSPFAIMACETPARDTATEVAACDNADIHELVECGEVPPPDCSFCIDWGRDVPRRWAITLSGHSGCGVPVSVGRENGQWIIEKWTGSLDGTYLLDKFETYTEEVNGTKFTWCRWYASIEGDVSVASGRTSKSCTNSNGNVRARCDTVEYGFDYVPKYLASVAVYTPAYRNGKYDPNYAVAVFTIRSWKGGTILSRRECAKSFTVTCDDEGDCPSCGMTDCGCLDYDCNCGTSLEKWFGVSATCTPEYA